MDETTQETIIAETESQIVETVSTKSICQRSIQKVDDDFIDCPIPDYFTPVFNRVIWWLYG